ncbi:peptide-N4-(N-acetyl-beta-glucosaminyl) asparagine amidase [Monoraphidium neglectum]|uniref:Peptide-N4-(N-acetyl-beta-glucosaminyl) asparagine amidase n=1 Tax=Monoraphidium neglectum TaxID=145388 RepID=A0A0D2MA64_9CHLO|nr:peptide-N4-(N-acetyl-beta-glucosaminyl) asparagine amidase [Monoraphidium neglectum]KIZ00150.1 peptide-N4-(N-acetyl-beta-glucosaminyl) asparagine amidase [Monoraphidium neglectum]|eukprot:XP_013899169.1 peptide-N4-(N-acetyl-beta-glucosaminyl) asparagine amidase [Monoraphidium neglectum]
MDSDAALAALLQLEEQQQAAIVAAIERDLHKCRSCEDPGAQAAALEAMPLARLREEARAAVALNRGLGASMELGETEILVQNMAQWFKGSFFSWMGTSAPCEACGGTAESQSMLEPLPEEAAAGAGRVEAFVCAACGAVLRFPRYTDPRKLLVTRKGRCGEWAHTFLLLLRAAGLDARHVHDHADHVWVEFYSHHLGRWVHVDPCETAFDTPLLYEQGWGKKYGLVISSGVHGIADTTRRYSKDHSVALQRRREDESLSAITDEFIARLVASVNQRLRADMQTQQRNDLIVRDLAEAMQLMMPELSIRKRRKDKAAAPAGAADGQQAGETRAAPVLPGRLSGPAAWRTARGEAGAAGAGGGAPNGPRAAPPAGTPYELVKPGAAVLAPLYAAAGQLFGSEGAACRASGQNGRGEGAALLFDGSPATKWLDFGGGGAGGQAWVELRLPAAAGAAVVAHYSLVSAGDCPERDPSHILLECVPARALDEGGAAGEGASGSGSQGGSGSAPAAAAAAAPAAAEEGWVALDERRGVKFAARGQLLSFSVSAPCRVPSRRWRLRVLAARDPATANSVQLAGWEAYTAGGAAVAAAPPVGDADACGSSEDAAGGGGGGEGYLTADARRALRSMAAAAQPASASAAPSDGAAGAAGSGPAADAAGTGAGAGGAGDAAALRLLRRVAANLGAEPADEKFFQLRGDKVAALLERPACLAALLAMGFRPVLLPPRPGGTRQLPRSEAGVHPSEVGLISDHTAAEDSGSDGRDAAQRAAAEVLALLGATCA